MKVLLETTVTKIGDMVDDFLQAHTLILFNDNVPAELHDMAVLHTPSTLLDDVKPGDTIAIGEDSYQVTSVGEKANETLREIGHCTIKFDGKNQPELPGTIHVESGTPQVKVGSTISFLRNFE